MLKLLKPLLAVLALSLFGSMAMAQASYRVSPGDVLQMEVLEDPTLNRPVLVLPDGSINLPQVGAIRAGGQTVAQIQAAVTAALAPSFAKPPTVYLAVGQLAPAPPERAPRTITVYTFGEVAGPGRIDVAPRTTLLQALAQSGGFTSFAATKRVQVRRVDSAGVEKIYQFNYAALSAGANAPVVYLQEGDVVMVPQRKLFE
jgi:polysaccharide export outer membrane protein